MENPYPQNWFCPGHFDSVFLYSHEETNAFAVNATLQQSDAGVPGSWLIHQLYLHSTPKGQGTALLQAEELGRTGTL